MGGFLPVFFAREKGKTQHNRRSALIEHARPFGHQSVAQ
jgi:hypothetical protein